MSVTALLTRELGQGKRGEPKAAGRFVWDQKAGWPGSRLLGRLHFLVMWPLKTPEVSSGRKHEDLERYEARVEFSAISFCW